MPCWSVQTNTVNLTNPDAELLTAALVAAGFRVNDAQYSQQFNASLTADRFTDRVSVQVVGGVVKVSSAERGINLDAISNEVKRSYSAQVVQAAARKFGWNLKTETAQKFTVARRF